MSTRQKFFELVHCTEGFQFVLSMMLWLITPILLLLLMISGNPVHLPDVFWAAAASLMLSRLLLRWLEYRMLGATFKDVLLAQIASMSLLHTREVASVTGLFTRKPLKWTRTSKFKARPSGLSALKSSSWEVVRGLVSLAVAGVAILSTETGLSTALMLGACSMATAGLSYLASPVMALLGERDLLLRRSSQRTGYVTKKVAAART